MSNYTPDRWQCIRIGDTIKVFGVWYGGYVGSDEWRLNSGVEKFVTSAAEGDVYYAYGYSGSIYKLHEGLEGVTGWGASILQGFVEDIENAGQVVYLLSIEEAIKFVMENS